MICVGGVTLVSILKYLTFKVFTRSITFSSEISQIKTNAVISLLQNMQV